MTLPSAPTPVRFEHRAPGAALGLTEPKPRLSWTIPNAPSEYVQHEYEIEIIRGGETSTSAIQSDEQILVPWPGQPLHSREEASVRVRVRCADDWSSWSEPSVVEAGLLSADDWTARFVSPVGLGKLRQAAPELRGSIAVAGDIARARLFATAQGIYTAKLNGVRVDDTVLAPGWTAYQHRHRYRAYDVTHLLHQGTNSLDVVLGNGWWRGRFGFLGKRAIYGDRLALLAQLEVTTTDGAVHVLSTDEGWRARSTGILADDIYDGQRTDMRYDSDAPFDGGVEEVDADLDVLVGEDGPPMRVTEVIPALRLWQSPSGKTLVDFGQNVVGWVRVRSHDTTPGTEVVLRHAEVLEAGELGIEPLRSARATDEYLVRGDEGEVLEPSLTFHGFRYAEISGIDGLRPADLDAIVVGSALQRTGWFTSSHEMLNRFHENVVWGMRGNFLDVPTDCPQRDERLGWTGDIQVFAPTATYLYDSSGFLNSWLADLAAEQNPDGSVPHVVPDILRTPLTSAPAAAWGDAAVVVPWTVWERTGDLGVLRRQFESMRAWVDKVRSVAGDDRIWRGGFQYGDWLDPAAPDDDAAAAKADPDVVATAHLYRSADLVARAAEVIGEHAQAERYRELADRVRVAFQNAFVTASGRILSDSQTVYAIALEWGLLESDAQRKGAGARLADLVRSAAFRIATGFVGTPVICDALTNAGYPHIAFRLLLQTKAPSWLYPVTMGATTVWERWDSLLPDGTINPSGMTSFNHYALGSVVDWMHRRIAGLAPSSPGYKTISVRPVPMPQLDYASARHDTPYGEASVSWSRSLGSLTLTVQVPVGSSAEVELPWDGEHVAVGHGVHSWQVAEPAHDDPPAATVRDLIDDEPRWNRFAQAAISAGVAVTETRIAQLLAPYFDHPTDGLPDGVWTKGWPSESAMKMLSEALAISPAASTDPTHQDHVSADAMRGSA
jgi:alpha-L-rhamnosidase